MAQLQIIERCQKTREQIVKQELLVKEGELWYSTEGWYGACV